MYMISNKEQECEQQLITILDNHFYATLNNVQNRYSLGSFEMERLYIKHLISCY